MNRFPLSFRYGLPLAIAMVLFSIVAQLWLRPYVGEIVFMALYPVIFLSAWICGTAPSLIAFLVGFFTVDYIFIGPTGTIGVYEVKDLIRILFFVLNNLLIIWALHRMRQAENRAHDHLQKALESEMQYRTIVELSPHIIWFSDKNGANIYNNQTWYEYTGLTPEESRHLQWTKIIHPADREHTVHIWMDAIQKLQPFEVELRLRRHDGEYRWFISRGKPVLNEHGEVERWIGKSVDFHEQKLAIATRDIFLSITSHELKTPLTALKLKMQVLDKKLKDRDDEVKNFEYLEKFIDSTLTNLHVFQNLIDEMLDVSRITSGKMTYYFETVNAKEILLNSVEIVSGQYAVANVPLHVEANKDIEFHGDQQKIIQVVVNLLTNALKYGNQTPVVIRLLEHDESLTIEVQDQGFGIDVADQRRVFECFERVNQNNISGLGIGLFISNQIINAHQGEIVLDSKLGVGSTFTVILPLKQS